MTTPAQLHFNIYQGATFRETRERELVPYPVRMECGRLVKEECGTPVPDSDITPEDYTDCTARMLIWYQTGKTTTQSERTVANGGLALSGKEMAFQWTAVESAAMTRWDKAFGIVEVTRPSGAVERQYEVTLSLDLRGEP